MGKKVNLEHLQAAMVLALNSTQAEPNHLWWDGVVMKPGETSYKVLQVDNERKRQDGLVGKALGVLSGHGIRKFVRVEGGAEDLLAIDVDCFENVLPSRVTRQWASEADPDEGHNKWKLDVTSRLDDLGIKLLRMVYSGSSDSGNEDEWECSRTGGEFWSPKGSYDFWYEAQRHELPDDLKDLISEYVWETLVQYDCVNNDGGGGSMEIRLQNDEPEFLFSCYTNEQITHDHDVDTPV